MNMKNEFKEPTIQYIALEDADIITVSGEDLKNVYNWDKDVTDY